MSIKPAASILVFYQEAEGPRFLMGCRSAKHKFMPGVFVFPGGKVDDEDKIPCHEECDFEVLTAAELRHLPCELSSFLNASLRELTEETGFSLYETGQFELTPVGKLHLIARAITPPYSPLRYDTLFFQIEVEKPTGSSPEIENTELERLKWYAQDEVLALPISGITTRILSQGHQVANLGVKTKFLAQI